MSSPKKKFVEYLGSEMEWPDLWAILIYLSTNRFLRVIFQPMPFGGAALRVVRLYLLLTKRDGTGSLFLCTARWSAWWAISHHNRGTGAFLPLGLPRLVAVEGGKEGWLQGCRALGVPAAEGDSEPWENGDARDPCWGWKGVFQVQDQSGEIKRRFDPFAVSCTARGTAHPAVAGGVAAPLGVLPSHPHMCGWHSLGQVVVRPQG